MIISRFYEFINYFFFYAKIFDILKALTKKKKLTKLKHLENTLARKKNYLYKKNSFIKKNTTQTINKFYLNIFNNKYYFNYQKIWNLEKELKDKEIFLYKIRFSWLLFGNDHLSNYKKLEIIMNFIKHYDISKSDSYSLGERISNWIMFIKVNEDLLSEEINNVLYNSIKNQILILINNLEYHGEKTNNHLLSNIKAVFLFSIYYNKNSHLKLCNEVFDFLNNHIFFKSGFLNEGSSHYHLLISKHIIEILYFNNIYNSNFLSENNIEFFTKVLSNIHIFSVTNELVNFGDSTPDLPIKYLKSLTYIAKKTLNIDYPVLFKDAKFSSNNYLKLFKINNFQVPKIRDLKYSFYDQNSGFVLISFDKLKLYLQLRNSNIIKARTHQHTEIGSFILFYKNKIIFNDLGRKNYNNNSISALGSNCHNSFKINNLEPLLCHKLNSIPGIMHKDYFQKKPNFNFIEEENKFIINIKFYGYERFPFKSVIERKFVIYNNQLEITDNIKSKKLVNYNSFFHSSLNIDKNDNNLNLIEHGTNICEFKILDKNATSIINENLSFNEYAKSNKINSIIISKKLKKEDNIKYIINLK